MASVLMMQPVDTLTTITAIWPALDDQEARVRQRMQAHFEEWHALVRHCEEAGMLAPLVPSRHATDLSLTTAAPFLRRTLNDLRAVWLLIERGYTIQASCVAASLYENALTAAVISGDEGLAREALKARNAEIPWTPKRLAQLDAERAMNLLIRAGHTPAPQEYEDAWSISYFNYKWLCQIKHPTWQAVHHDLQGGQTAPGVYAIRPGPNTATMDDSLKARILGICASQVFIATSAFLLALAGDIQSAEYQAVARHLGFIQTEIPRLMQREQDKPASIQVLDRSFIKTDLHTLPQTAQGVRE